MRLIIPIILIILAVAMFFGYIDPTYDKVTETREKIREFDAALNRANELDAVLNRLLDTYNSFSTEDLERLRRILPDHIDSVRLVIDIDGIAAKHGLRLGDISINNESGEETASSAGDTDSPSMHGVAVLGFDVKASYEVFKKFLMDLEDSLRIVDVESLNFGASEKDDSSYSVSIKTYWLK